MSYRPGDMRCEHLGAYGGYGGYTGGADSAGGGYGRTYGGPMHNSPRYSNQNKANKALNDLMFTITFETIASIISSDWIS